MTRETLSGSFQFRDLLSIAPTFPNKADYALTYEGKFEIRKGLPWPKETKDGYYAYVLMPPRKDAPEGVLCIAMKPRPSGNIHHPELTHRKGLKEPKEVVAAGMIRILNREVVLINNESGHYHPEPESLVFAAQALKFWGIPRAKNLTIEDKWALLSKN